MSLQTDLAAAVAKVTVDGTLLHRVVHGPAAGGDSLIATEGGPVKTLARAVADAEDLVRHEMSDLTATLADARSAGEIAATFAALAGEKAGAADDAAGRASAVVDRAESDIRSIASTAEADLGGLIARAENETQAGIVAAGAAAAEAETAAAEARAHCQRFALPIEAVARRALAADARQLVGTRDTLTLFSAFADEAGRSEAAARASADEAARQAGLAADQVGAVSVVADAARASVSDALNQADANFRALVAGIESDIDGCKAEIATVGADAGDRITATAAGFDSEVRALADQTTGQVNEAVAEAESAASEARAHAARFALPIEAVARRALAADSRQLASTRDTLTLFSAFADEAGRSEAAAKASADEAAQQAEIAATQMVAARQAADAARTSVVDAAALVANADAGLRALVADAQSGVASGKATILSVASAAEDRIASAAAGFESEVLALATSAATRIDAATAHVARFVIPIEQVACAALDAERRRLRVARDDLLRFSTLIQS
jgi:hypothetical protein